MREVSLYSPDGEKHRQRSVFSIAYLYFRLWLDFTEKVDRKVLTRGESCDIISMFGRKPNIIAGMRGEIPPYRLTSFAGMAERAAKAAKQERLAFLLRSEAELQTALDSGFVTLVTKQLQVANGKLQFEEMVYG